MQPLNLPVACKATKCLRIAAYVGEWSITYQGSTKKGREMKTSARLVFVWAYLLFFMFLAFGIDTQVAWAHGHIHVGDYELTIGFVNEPAYQGEPNGLDLRVVNTTNDQPVSGLAESLQAEVIYGASKREVTLRSRFGQEGAYIADLLPTVAGDYTWHIWGEIEGTPVDVTMTSSPDTFSSVQSKDAVSFPAAEPLAADMMSAAADAAQNAQLALIVGIVGIVLGAIGTVVGLLGLRAARRAT